MSNRETYISRDYAEAIFQRVIRPMPPYNFEPDWDDQPSRFKIYSDAERIALPTNFPARLAPMADVLHRIGTPQPEGRSLSYEELSTMLQFAHGAHSRRLRITWNHDARALSVYPVSHFAYARGTASGGGMYPTEIYWGCGASGALLPGLYHYNNAHHAMERLFAGDITQRIRTALFEHPLAMNTDQFLFISLNFWKNSFKYNSFCYHVVTQDLGALLCSLRLMATGFDSDLYPLLWFQDETLNQLLGLDTAYESVFAVIPVPTSGHCEPSVSDTTQALTPLHRPLVNKETFQRSKRVFTFGTNRLVHEATLVTDERQPAVSEAFHARADVLPTSNELVALPPPDLAHLQDDLLETFLQRRSSFGSFSAHIPLSRNELATLLYFGSSVSQYVTDLKQANGEPHFTRLMVFVNHTDGIEPGAYAYDRVQHCLLPLHKGDLTLFLQQNYFLQNYNLAETGALIAIVGNVDGMLNVYGNRGYRILNAEVGMVAQGLYMAATALSVACGAALGFDNTALNTMLGLDGTGHKTLLFLMAGHERQNIGNFDYRLF